MNKLKEFEEKLEEDLMEKLAGIEHQRWADWQEHIMDIALKSGSDDIGIRTFGWDTEKVKTWEEQIETLYSELSEEDKEKDREQVRRYLPILNSWLSKAFEEVRQEARNEALVKILEADEYIKSFKSSLLAEVEKMKKETEEITVFDKIAEAIDGGEKMKVAIGARLQALTDISNLINNK